MTAWVIVGLCALNIWTLWRWHVTITAWSHTLDRERELLVMLSVMLRPEGEP